MTEQATEPLQWPDDAAQIVIAAYPHFDMLPINPKSVGTLHQLWKRAKEAGDGLLTFIAAELDDADVDSPEAVRRLQQAIDDLTAVRDGIARSVAAATPG